ncbi:MAG: hypothetical protein K2X98_05975 [Alphaproteobacteria bacterium]|nr:hypothetical protein [Alphaproteobacteria bacterium]
MAFDDYRSRTVRLLDVLIVCVLFLIIYTPSASTGVMTFGAGGIFYGIQLFLKKKFLAFADTVLLCLTPLILPMHHLPGFFIALGGTLIAYHFMTQKDKAPFITAYFLCLGIFLILGFFN